MDKRILLVDDEEGIRKVLGISLADIGYEVLTAADGKQALALFTQHKPPIVITDIKMPVMDGIELLKHIKRENSEAEVIMLTGHGDMDLAIECLKLEATDFITKPINDDVLEISLKRAWERILIRQQLREYTENLERLVVEKSAQLVAAERRAAVGQALEGLAAAMQNIASDLDTGMQYFNDLPCFVSIHSPQLEVVAANQRYLAKLGDAVGQPSWKAYVKVGEASSADHVEATFASGRGQRKQATVVFKDGTQTPVIVHTAPIRNAQGAVELVVEIAADVTEIRRLQDELRATQQRYEQLFNEAPCYITVQDENMKVTAANRRFREDFKDPIGCHCYETYKLRQSTCPDCPVMQTFKDGQSHHCEMEVPASNGGSRQMLIWTAPLRNAFGKITQVMEMSTDITQVRKLQDQLSSLGLLIGSVSHGIKGLLTGLDSGMYMLDSGFSKGNHERIEEGRQLIRFMVERIRKMVLDILHYAKGKDLKWEKLNAAEFSQDVVQSVLPEITDPTILLTSKFDNNIKDVEVEVGILHATLINILENAIEACNADSAKSSHEIVFSVKQDDRHIVFEVADNGIGMNKETQDKIFTPFFTSKGGHGTGLGLYFTNQILRQQGGRMTMESTFGKGSRFRVFVPISTSLKSKNNPNNI
ncbi:MAG: response regulator [Desulfobacteraceae bacterium]|jgi:PAS domain S-box-containing protein